MEGGVERTYKENGNGKLGCRNFNDDRRLRVLPTTNGSRNPTPPTTKDKRKRRYSGSFKERRRRVDYMRESTTKSEGESLCLLLRGHEKKG